VTLLDLHVESIRACPILVVGADGNIGRALSTELRRLGADLFETTRRIDSVGGQRLYLDLLMSEDKWELPESIQVSFVCAGVTVLKECEQNPSNTSTVNVDNTLSLIRRLLDNGSSVIYLSTVAVVDGSSAFASDEVENQPSCEYSRQKAEVERTLLEWNEDRLAILRITKVLSPQMPLINEWIRSLKSGVAIHPFSDLVIAPVSLNYVVNSLIQIAASETYGMFQVTGDRDISYADAAIFIADKLGVDKELVQPRISKEMGIDLMSNPSHATLNANRIQKELGIEPANVWVSISEAFSLYQ